MGKEAFAFYAMLCSCLRRSTAFPNTAGDTPNNGVNFGAHDLAPRLQKPPERIEVTFVSVGNGGSPFTDGK